MRKSESGPKVKIREMQKIIREIRGKITQAEKFESKYEVQRLLREVQFLSGKETKK